MGASDRFSRTISKDKLGGAAQWELRPLPGGTRVGGSVPLSARASAAEREQNGYEAGRQQGYQDVMRSAQQARAADLQRLEAVLAQLQHRIDELGSGIADTLLDLALDVAAQVLRREVRTGRDVILPVVREALSFVIDTCAQPTVRLAPVDFELVRESLAADANLAGCRLVADPGVQPGGCLIETPHGELDATLATRWRRVVQTLGIDAPLPDIDAAEPVPPAGGRDR
jgi:flagellar assembly protein FliH